jgi:hypothetical protein
MPGERERETAAAGSLLTYARIGVNDHLLWGNKRHLESLWLQIRNSIWLRRSKEEA